MRTEVQRFLAVAIQTQIHLEIERAEDQPLDARGLRNLRRPIEADRRFDERQNGHARGKAVQPPART